MILLIDLASLVYPLWHLSGNQPDPNWTSAQAVARVHQLTPPDAKVAVCADSGTSARKAIDPTYKANRPDRDAPLLHQLKLTQERLKADGYPLWAVAGCEADDVIATATRLAVERGETVTIASSDKDLLQLVADGSVGVQSLTNGVLYDEAAVILKFGVAPSQMGDWLALVGDASDNIKGAPGIGPKKATQLLTAYKTLDVLLNGGLTEVQPSIVETLKTHRDQIRRARQLITLDSHAAIPFDDIDQPRIAAEESETMTDPLDETAVTEPPLTEPKLTSLDRVDVTPSGPRTSLVVESEWTRQLEPRTLNDARVISKWVFASRLFSQFGSEQAVFSVLMAGRELNLGVMASLRGFHVIQGRPAMAADLMRALVMASGKAEYFMCTERTPTQATWVTQRKGDPEPTALTYTIAEAEAARLVAPNTGWTKHPADMVAKTASSKLCRLVYADVTFGLYSVEELGGEDL